MAYYDALIAKWPTLPAGTTAQKLANLNAQTAVGAAIPMIIPTYLIYDLIVLAEFDALTAAQQAHVREVLNMGTCNASPSSRVRTMFTSFFGAATTSRSNLTALAATYDSPQIPWWQANGYSSATNSNDLTAAGGLT